MIQDARSATYLLELRDAAVSEPVDLCTLLLWMNANDLSLMVTEWVRWMPPEMIARPPVCLGVPLPSTRHPKHSVLGCETTSPAPQAVGENLPLDAGG